MDKERAVGWAIGIIVTLCIIMLCKGCMGEPDTSGLKKNKNKTQPEQTTGVSVFTGTVTTEKPELDIFGRPVVTSAVPETYPEESETTTAVETETDIFGNTFIVTTAPQTDIFGNIITEEFPETTENPENMTDFLSELPVTTLSPDEQYQSALTDPASIGGFNHNKYDSDGNPIETLPSDFVIIID